MAGVGDEGLVALGGRGDVREAHRASGRGDGARCGLVQHRIQAVGVGQRRRDEALEIGGNRFEQGAMREVGRGKTRRNRG